MKKTILLMVALLMIPIVFGAVLPALTEPYSKTLTPQGQFGKTWTTVKSELAIKSCYDKANYEVGNCDYLYWCYAILPATSTSIYDALQKECKEATKDIDVSLAINKFVPPKGLPFYVTSFVTRVNYVYDKVTSTWKETASIPNAYTTADQIRTICNEGQMLKLTPLGYQCYKSQRVCMDTTASGLCTNPYNIFALDLNNDGVISSIEVKDATNYCVDRPTLISTGDGICDTVQDLGCADVCSKYSTTGVCTTIGGNGICDIWDQISNTACVDDINSKNSKICDTLEVGSGICPNYYDPVCYGGRGGTTYPNKCFANSLSKTPYTIGACEPPVTQCYVVQDCPDVNACVGGSTPIAKACLLNQCSYSGTCGDLACSTNTQCDTLEANLCVGVDATCVSGQCQIQGKCITQPIPTQKSVWELILSVFTAFFNFIKSLFGA